MKQIRKSMYGTFIFASAVALSLSVSHGDYAEFTYGTPSAPYNNLVADTLKCSLKSIGSSNATFYNGVHWGNNVAKNYQQGSGLGTFTKTDDYDSFADDEQSDGTYVDIRASYN